MDFDIEVPSLKPPPQQTSYMMCNSHEIYNNLNLRQQDMLNQFISIADCSIEQACYLLSSSNWQYQVALNTFFDDTTRTNSGENKIPINKISNSFTVNAPKNTPVTPPNIDFLEKAFSKLNSSFQNSLNSDQNSSNYEMNSSPTLSSQSMKSSNLQPITDAQYAESVRFHYYNN